MLSCVRRPLRKLVLDSSTCLLRPTPFAGVLGVRRLSSGSTSIGDAVRASEQRLTESNVPEPGASALHLMAHVLGQKSLCHITEKFPLPLTPQQHALYQQMLELRLQRHPVQYILGEWDFRYLTLELRPPVLIPRCETEELVGFVLDDAKGRLVDGGTSAEPPLHGSACQLQGLDIGCGSGAISLALLDECPQIHMTAVDISQDAVDLTQLNATRLGLVDRLSILKCEAASLPEELQPESFDLVVSNPPYVPSNEVPTLSPELHFEDHRAFDGGQDGLVVVLDVLQAASRLLKQGGSVWLELDDRHPPLIQDLIQRREDISLEWIDWHADYQEKPRFCHLRKT